MWATLTARTGRWENVLCVDRQPYICAEVDMGGLPSWLLRDPSMRVRSSHEGFLAAARRYMDWLLPLVVPLQQSLGGPIIAVQVYTQGRLGGCPCGWCACWSSAAKLWALGTPSAHQLHSVSRSLIDSRTLADFHITRRTTKETNGDAGILRRAREVTEGR